MTTFNFNIFRARDVNAPVTQDLYHNTEPPLRAHSLGSHNSRLLSRLEYSQHDVMVPDYYFDDSHLDALIKLEEECWKDGGVLRFYASLLLAYSLLKGGSQHCVRHRNRLANIRSFAFNNCEPESMAARWILGRLELSMASIEEHPSEKARLIGSAYKLFSGIEPVTLRMPILLPGAKSECRDENLDTFGDPSFDPLVIELPIPHRYCANTAISLASLGNFAQTSLLERARNYCVEALHTSGTPPRLNIDLVEIVIQSISRGRLGTGDAAEDISCRIENTINKIVSARHSCLITPRKEKEKEWIASCYASLALATTSGLEHENAICAMKKAITDYLKIQKNVFRNQISDFIFIDLTYRLVIAQRNEQRFLEFIQELLPYKAIVR